MIKMNEKLKIDEVILLLLNEGKIRGKSISQGEVFLAWKEIFGEYMIDPLFHLEQDRLYSYLVRDAIRQLKLNNYIIIEPIGEGHNTYYINEKGKNLIKEILGKKKFIYRFLPIIKEKKSDWDEWTIKGLSIYVNRKYLMKEEVD
jgi:DNA-binding PadR family transcriptional regulator